jgi:hypothetical protein
MENKFFKSPKTKRAKKIKALVEKYQVGIKNMEKKLVTSVHNYKLAIEEERVEMAKKRAAKQ